MISLVQYVDRNCQQMATYMNESKEVPVNGFSILKPGFLDKQEDIENLLNDNGWTISDVTKVKMTKDDARNLYKCHEKEEWYDDLCDYMSSDKCICYQLYNKDSKDPIEDLKKVKDIARKKWGKDEMKNCMHSSDSKDNVKRESKICFSINDSKI